MLKYLSQATLCVLMFAPVAMAGYDGESNQEQSSGTTTDPSCNFRPSASGFTAEDIRLTLEVHNRERALLGNEPLSWSSELASIAQGWSEANHDRLKKGWSYTADWGYPHSAGSCYGDKYGAGGPGRGENMGTGPYIYGYGDGPQNAAENLMEAFAAEKEDWNDETGVCAPGKKCGHYRAMAVWKATEVGCGIAGNDGVDLNRKQVITCLYNSNFGGTRLAKADNPEEFLKPGDNALLSGRCVKLGEKDGDVFQFSFPGGRSSGRASTSYFKPDTEGKCSSQG